MCRPVVDMLGDELEHLALSSSVLRRYIGLAKFDLFQQSFCRIIVVILVMFDEIAGALISK
jgi:hypothetical protein